jgi:choline dehydrogenase
VGENLQEHSLLAGLCFEPSSELPGPNNNLEGSVAFWHSDPGLTRPDLMSVSMQVPYVSAGNGARCAVPPDGFSIVPGLSMPRIRGRLSLDGGGGLRIQPNMPQDGADVTALLLGVELGLDLATRPGFRQIVKRQVVPDARMTRAERLSFVREAAMPYLHRVGTCAMGSVVDAELRVHGVEGLRIAEFAGRLLTTG